MGSTSLHDDALVLDVLVGLDHVVCDGAHVVAVVVDGLTGLVGGVVDVVLVGGVLDAVPLLDLGAAAGVQVAAGERRAAAHVVVGVDEDDGEALVEAAQPGGQAGAAGAEHHDVCLVVPSDVARVGRVAAHEVAVGDLDVGVDVGQGGAGEGAGRRGAGDAACCAAQEAAAGNGF